MRVLSRQSKQRTFRFHFSHHEYEKLACPMALVFSHDSPCFLSLVAPGLLGSLPASEVPLQQAVFRLCEAWWKKGLLGKEELGRTAFLICLEKSFMLKKPVRTRLLAFCFKV